MANATFTQLSADLSNAIGLDLPIKDEWRTWEHDLEVPIHDGEWHIAALQLSVEPSRGRKPARIGASIVVDRQPRHYTIRAGHAPKLIAWADAGATGVPSCVAGGEAVEVL